MPPPSPSSRRVPEQEVDVVVTAIDLDCPGG
jgi:hypothetical protein